ncbi:MAG TPA: hypothetical protein VI277_03175 [Candidatus Limnocylindria bacterium]
MGLILDLAVAILAGLVIVSLALLAWTLAVTSVRAIQAERERVRAARRGVADAEARIRSSASSASAVLAGIASRAEARLVDGDQFDR